MAQCVRDALKLDKILFIPAAIPPHKIQNHIVEAELRWKMLTLATHNNPQFEVSRIELDHKGPSFTVHTLKRIHSIYRINRENLFLLLGADSLVMLHQWYQPHALFKLSRIVVFPRPEIDLSNTHPDFQQRYIFVNTPLVAISSSEIRNRIRQGRSIRYFVPETVEQFIIKQHLYR